MYGSNPYPPNAVSDLWQGPTMNCKNEKCENYDSTANTFCAPTCAEEYEASQYRKVWGSS